MSTVGCISSHREGKSFESRVITAARRQSRTRGIHLSNKEHIVLRSPGLDRRRFIPYLPRSQGRKTCSTSGSVVCQSVPLGRHSLVLLRLLGKSGCLLSRFVTGPSLSGRGPPRLVAFSCRTSLCAQLFVYVPHLLSYTSKYSGCLALAPAKLPLALINHLASACSRTSLFVPRSFSRDDLSSNKYIFYHRLFFGISSKPNLKSIKTDHQRGCARCAVVNVI